MFGKEGVVAGKGIYIIPAIIGLIFLSAFAVTALTVTKTDFTTAAYNFDEDVSSRYNLTVNNSIASLANAGVNNITQVNVTFPSSFVLLNNLTNGTTSNATFSIRGSVLSWTNSSEGVLNASIIGVLHSFWMNATALSPGLYNITVQATNWTNVFNANLTVRVNDTTRPDVSTENISLPLQSGGNYTGTVIFNVSVSDNSLINTVFFNITNATGQVMIVNLTNPTGNYWNGTFLTSALGDGSYNVSVYANNTFGNFSIVNDSARIPVKFDNTAPTISGSCSPATVYVGETTTCSCTATDATSGINTSFGTSGISITASPSTQSTGSQTTACSTVDLAGNTASANAAYNVESSGGGAGSGGSGSGSSSTNWVVTYPFATVELSERGAISQAMGANNRMSVKVSGETHYVGVKSISGTSSAVVEISSTPQSATMNVGESRMFEVTGDGFYDMKVTLVSIESNKAMLKTEYVHEEVPAGETTGTGTGSTGGTTGGAGGGLSGDAGSSSMIWWIIGIIVVIVIVVVVVWQRNKKN